METNNLALRVQLLENALVAYRYYMDASEEELRERGITREQALNAARQEDQVLERMSAAEEVCSYYFYSMMERSMWPNAPKEFRPRSVVTKNHPIAEMLALKQVQPRDRPLFEYVLLNWQEITKEEYDLYNKLNLAWQRNGDT